MGGILDIVGIGKKIYDTKKSREARRFVVFVARAFLNRKRMERLEEFFTKDPLLARVAAECPTVYEQPTRAFFYNGSTFDTRIELLFQHMNFLKETCKEEVLSGLYGGETYSLWESRDNGEPLRFELGFRPGQKKEGLLSLVMRLSEQDLYQVMFWIAPDAAGEPSLWIGALQGPNMENAKDIIVRVTRRFHSYRTKNFMLHATQEMAKALGLRHIYAVTNQGYYANAHIRLDRKLKTDFTEFWKESGGRPCKDARFYELPMTEARKTPEEIPARKRNYYRKRYALLDEVDAAIASAVQNLLQAK